MLEFRVHWKKSSDKLLIKYQFQYFQRIPTALPGTSRPLLPPRRRADPPTAHLRIVQLEQWNVPRSCRHCQQQTLPGPPVLSDPSSGPVARRIADADSFKCQGRRRSHFPAVHPDVGVQDPRRAAESAADSRWAPPWPLQLVELFLILIFIVQLFFQRFQLFWRWRWWESSWTEKNSEDVAGKCSVTQYCQFVPFEKEKS